MDNATSSNAYEVYWAAHDGLPDTADFSRIFQPVWTPRRGQSPADDPRLPGWRRLLASAQPSLVLIDRALGLDFRHPADAPVCEGRSLLRLVRDLGRLARVRQLVALLDGDEDASIRYCIDMLRMGHQLAQGYTFLSAFAGTCVMSFGRASLWGSARRLEAERAARLARRIEEIMQSEVTFLALAYGEREWFVAECRRRHAEDDWRSRERREWENSLPEMREWLERQLAKDDGTLLGEGLAHREAVIAAARRPCREPLPEPTDPSPYSMVTENRIRCIILRNQAANRLLAVAFALRAWQLRRGRLPKRLSDLCPEYLVAVPGDPFGDLRPLCYRRTGLFDYRLYSRGPDGLDSRGRAIGTRWFWHRTGCPIASVEPDSTGDLVCWSNTDRPDEAAAQEAREHLARWAAQKQTLPPSRDPSPVVGSLPAAAPTRRLEEPLD